MVYQLKIKLQNVTKPPVWRRVLVPSWITFNELHRVIQDAMGWDNVHLYQFEYEPYSRGVHICMPDDYGMDPSALNSLVTPVGKYLNAKHSKMVYIYDFGDDWIHDVIIEKILEDDEVKEKLPVCLAAKGACPPEDCGGPWGYEDLKMLAEKETITEDEADRLDWYGIDYDFDSKYVDLDEINDLLENISLKKPREKKADTEKLTASAEEIKKLVSAYVEKLDDNEFSDYCNDVLDLVSNGELDITRGKKEIWAAAVIAVAASDLLKEIELQEICDHFGLKQAGVKNRMGQIYHLMESNNFQGNFEDEELDFEDNLFDAFMKIFGKPGPKF